MKAIANIIQKANKQILVINAFLVLFFVIVTVFYFFPLEVNKNSELHNFALTFYEVRDCRVAKSSYETEFRKMTSYFELLTRIFLQKFFFRVTNSTL